MIPIAAIMVLYNKEIEDAITYNSLLGCDTGQFKVNLIVVDNSTIENRNREICEINGIKYIDMQGNKGISKAYNAGLECIDDAELVLLLDDDTEITSDYFDKLYNKVDKHPERDIFAPIVEGQDGVIYSPNEFHFLKNHFIGDYKQPIHQKDFNAIASCLAIRSRVFDDYRFNELLFVDQVDQFFFCEQRKLGRKFCRINTVIKQNFYQRGEELNSEYAWKRLKIRIPDIYRHAYLMKEKVYILGALVKCSGLSLQIGKKCKSIKVIVKGVLLSIKSLFIWSSWLR